LISRGRRRSTVGPAEGHLVTTARELTRDQHPATQGPPPRPRAGAQAPLSPACGQDDERQP